MLLKYVLASAVLAVGTAQVIQLECNHRTPNSCYIENQTTNRVQRQYSIITTEEPNQIDHLEVIDSKVTFWSHNFCRTLGEVKTIKAIGQGIEVLDQDAFLECAHLVNLLMQGNLIQVIPEDIIRFNFHLERVYLQDNGIGRMPERLFEANLKLVDLRLDNNLISTFSARTLQRNRELVQLNLHSNDIYDLEVDVFLSYVTKLKMVWIDGNIFPCSRVAAIVGTFNEKNVTIEDGEGTRDRIFRMGNVEGVACIDGQ